MIRFITFTLGGLMLSLPLVAQQGDRAQHSNTDSVVPEELVPPAPVLSPEESLATYQVADGFTLDLYAAEPLVFKPVALDIDAAGRLWVCEMIGFMPNIDGEGQEEPRGAIVVLEDTDKDGLPDKRTVFLDNLVLPRAVTAFPDGILFIDNSRLCWVPRKGVKKSGEVEVIDPKFSASGSIEYKPNGLVRNIDNWLYLARANKRIRREDGKWRIEATSSRGQWGIDHDEWGRLYHNNNSVFLFGDILAPNLLSANPNVKMPYKEAVRIASNRIWPARVTPGVNRGYIAKINGYDTNELDPKTFKQINTTSASGVAIYRGTNFPPEWKGAAFIGDPAVNLIKAIRVHRKADGTVWGEHAYESSEIAASTDERSRPVSTYNSPDGSILVLDLYHGIIQEKTFVTSYLRKQMLDRDLDKHPFGNGRIFRLRYKSGKLVPPLDLTSLEPRELVRQLAHSDGWRREAAQRLIVDRGDADSSLISLIETVVTAKAVSPVARAHAIWTLEGLHKLQAKHLVAAINDTDADLQASALWAATTLSAVELAKLVPTLIALQPAESSLPYLARILGQTGDQQAFVRLGKLLAEPLKVRFIRQAAVSGLAGHEQVFIDSVLADAKDKDRDLLSWLKQGAAPKSGKIEKKGPSLTGDELASYKRGKALYLGEAACVGCHGADGAGLPEIGLPLAGSEWVTGNPETLVRIILHGYRGPIEVAGIKYDSAAEMPGLSFNENMTDRKIADVVTYIRNAWDNKADAVAEGFVTKQRAATKDRAGRPLEAADLSR